MLQSIYIVNEAGETLGSLSFSKFDIDDALFGGFLSAIQMFSQQMSGKNVKELSMENHRLIISEFKDGYIVTVHDRDDKDAVELSLKVKQIVNDELFGIVTDDFLELLKKEVGSEARALERADDWASKML